MSTSKRAGDGICILSFDSGGPGTYLQLLILKECMSRLANDAGASEDDVYPADYFDLMGGVGFGGLVALMLGHFRMNISQAVDSLLDVADTVFPESSQQTLNLERNSERLKAAIEDILQARQIPLDAKMHDPSRPQTGCKVVVYAATSASISHPHVFRTYSSRGSSSNPTIVEAICATISVPSHFLPVKVGPQRRAQSFIGGPFGAFNPTRELLKEAGLAFGNDKRVAQIISIGCGTPRTLSLKEARDEAGVGNLLKEMAADCHLVAQELSNRLFSVEAYRRFDVERGMGNVEIENWSQLGDIETHTRSYIERDAVTKALEDSIRCLRGRIGTATLGQINQSSSIKVAAKTPPAVSSHYVVRTKPWKIMVHYLVTSPSSRQRVLPITGMGGCGKTQMVSYFLQEYPSLFTHVAYVDASSSSSAESDFQTWSRALGDGHERDVWEDGFRILSNVPQNERWALILDNADDPKLQLVSFMPKSVNLTVVITSRNRDLGTLSTTFHLELGEMEEDEALATLLQAARRESPLPTEEMESARALIKELGYLALALVQAGTYCHQMSSYHRGILQPYTFTQYLALFYSHRAELMKKTQPSPLDSYERGVYTTLDLSYQALSQVNREFLHLISFFHHADIPVAALATAARVRFGDVLQALPRSERHGHVIATLVTLLCANGEWSDFQMQETISSLRSFSLISATSVSDSVFLQLHPLIQSWSRDTTRSDSQHYRAMAVQILTSCGGRKNLFLHRHILSHLLDILTQVNVQDLHVNDLVSVGEILRDQGQYRTASRLFEAALENITSCKEDKTQDRLTVTECLAGSYWSEGRWTEAENLYLTLLEQRRKVLGPEHPDTFMAAASLASTYSRQGRHSEAEKLNIAVLEQRSRVLGLEHPQTIAAAGNLALTYSQQGRHGEAEKLRVDVLEQQKKVLGLGHVDTILAAGNLASTYSQLGRYSEAEKLNMEVLEQRKRALGQEHPHTIVAAGNLALTYSQQGRHGEAEKLNMKVLEQRRRVLGHEHPDTIMAAGNLALIYSQLGRHNEAEKLNMEVLEQRRRVLGLEHPHTILAAKNLAHIYKKQARYDEAVELLAPAVKLSSKVLGQQHPSTQKWIKILAGLYETLGKEKEAEETMKLLIS